MRRSPPKMKPRKKNSSAMGAITHTKTAALSRPRVNGPEEGVRGVPIRSFEEPEHPDVVGVHLVVQPVVDCRNPSDDDAMAPGQEEGAIGVGEEGVLRCQALAFGQAERWNPVRIAGVACVRVIDEAPEVAATADRTHSGRVGHGNSEFGIWNLEFGMRNEFLIPNPECQCGTVPVAFRA